ncbi:TPA: hypothetical protein R9Y23_006048 [Bacillus cereus]|nr:hypothetical protein [Bacillus cereus]HEF1869673.1 hypothetical protein [Bacillus cereus]HEF1880228.1 hypothetical protein [Bacillus cereus]HEF1886377.1 hypothetical protein [Bacillus cereus]
MKKDNIYINWFKHIAHLTINQHIYNNIDEKKEISSLFLKGTTDMFRPEDIKDKDRELIKQETDYLRSEQERRLDNTEKQYIDSLDYNDWKEINRNLVEQNGEYPPLRIKELFENAVSLRQNTKIYIKASDVGLHSVNNYGDIGAFWIGSPIPPNDIQNKETVIELTLPVGTKTLILPDGTHVLNQSAFEIDKYSMYAVGNKTEILARGKLIDQAQITMLLEQDQLIQKAKLTGAYQDKNVFAKNKPVFSLEEVKGPYASFFLEKFFADPDIQNAIIQFTDNIPQELLSSLVDYIDIEKKGFIRFTTKEIPYGINPAQRKFPYAKYIADGKYIEVILPDPTPNVLTKDVLDYMTHDVKKAFADAMDDQFFRYLTNTAREVGQIPAKLADVPKTKEILSNDGYSNFYEFLADLWSNDPEKRETASHTSMAEDVLPIDISSIQLMIHDSNSDNPLDVDNFLRDWASRGEIITAPFVPDRVQQYFFSTFLPGLFEELQKELIQNNWNLAELSAYNGRLYKTYQNSAQLLPYLIQPVISPLEKLQKEVEGTLHEIKENYISALNPATKMFDLSQITDPTLLSNSAFVDALGLIMNKIPGQILDTLLNQMDPQQNGLIQPVPVSPDNANGVVTDPSILTIQLVTPDILTPEALNKMTHEGKKQIGYTLDATLFRDAYIFIHPKEARPETFSTSEALTKIIQEEKNKFIPKYMEVSANTNQKFFAEVFASYLSEDIDEQKRVENEAPNTVIIIRNMIDVYTNNIQHIRDPNFTRAIAKSLPRIETYTSNIVDPKRLPSILQNIRDKVLEEYMLNPEEQAVARVIETIRPDADTFFPIIVYGPNSMEKLKDDIEDSLTNSEIVESDLNISATPDFVQDIKKKQPIFNPKEFAYTFEPTTSSDTAVYCTKATTIKDLLGETYVIPISNFSEFQSPSQFVNEIYTTVINRQQSDIQLEKATLQINKDFIREFHLTGKLIEVDKKIVFSEDKVSKVKAILKSIMKIEAFVRIVPRILQKLNPIYGDIYVIVPKSQETLIPSNAAYKSDWDQENNRIVLELPSGKEKKETPKQVSGLLYAFSKKAYTIAKESGGAAGIAISQFDIIVTKNLSFESLKDTILKGSGIDITNDPRFMASNLSITTKNHNYFGALGSLYYTNPDFLNNMYPDLFIQISSVFNNLPQ